MKLQTRKQIIDLWSKQSEEFLNSFCCPSCRDLLFETSLQISVEKSRVAYCCLNNQCCLHNEVLLNEDIEEALNERD